LAILILAVACFNLANTSMALMSRRVKEIGIRKTLGTSNRQLFIQFMLETLITSFLAFIVAILLTDVIGEQIWGLFGASFFLKDISIIRFMPFLVGFLLCCTFLAGVLPAMYAWRFSPTSMLNSGKSLKGVSGLQKALTVGQYAVSICLLVSAWVFSKNGDYFGTIDLHYNYKDIVMVPLDSPEDYEIFRNEIDLLSSTVEVIGTSGHHGVSRTRASFNTDSIDIEVASFHVSPEYLTTMEIELVEGRDFIASSQAEKEKSIIVNEEFAKRYLSEVDPFEYRVSLNGEKRNIVGICKDIIHEIYYDYKPTPMVYFPASTEEYDVVLAKTDGGKTDELEKEIQAVWAGLFDTPYRGKPQSHVSSFFASRDARNLKLVFTGIAVLGSMLSLIGIFSLAALNVNKRLKEISIRRVLGASINQVMLIINKSFITMLSVALLVGVVGGLWLSEAVLQMIYKFYLSGSLVDSIGIGLLVVLVAAIFISLAAIRPVLANPSEGLRDE
jgi:putative ABC transport system permease protein